MDSGFVYNLSRSSWYSESCEHLSLFTRSLGVNLRLCVLINSHLELLCTNIVNLNFVSGYPSPLSRHMINPPDDLLADLQSALPPEQQTQSPLPTVAAGSGSTSYSNGAPSVNGHTSPPHDHLYDHTEHPGMSVPPERASVASTVSQ